MINEVEHYLMFTGHLDIFVCEVSVKSITTFSTEFLFSFLLSYFFPFKYSGFKCFVNNYLPLFEGAFSSH